LCTAAIPTPAAVAGVGIGITAITAITRTGFVKGCLVVTAQTAVTTVFESKGSVQTSAPISGATRVESSRTEAVRAVSSLADAGGVAGRDSLVTSASHSSRASVAEKCSACATGATGATCAPGTVSGVKSVSTGASGSPGTDQSGVTPSASRAPRTEFQEYAVTTGAAGAVKPSAGVARCSPTTAGAVSDLEVAGGVE
jgi:hypothetical protein